MEKEFIPYEQALALKELGFNEPCFGCYEEIEQRDYKVVLEVTKFICLNTLNGISNYNQDGRVSCPTFSQAFRWFRDKHNINNCIIPLIDESGFVYKYQAIVHREESAIEHVGGFDTHEEAELACLRKLIEIVKTKDLENK